MKKEKKCPECGGTEKQHKQGFNQSGTQRYKCQLFGKKYTLEPKRHAYSDEIKAQALKTYFSGVSGRGVGNLFGMSKANVYNWIKKTKNLVIELVQTDVVELDELYWFIGRKERTKTRENVYVMTMVSREPRQLAGVVAATDKSARRIQAMVDAAPEADKYCTDGYTGYLDVVYPGKHIRNVRDRSDTFTVEGVNADLRHYIPILARSSRCFPRKLETLQAVLAVFAEAYNRFGVAKLKWRASHDKGEVPFSVIHFL